jgi:hypothetical protein
MKSMSALSKRWIMMTQRLFYSKPSKIYSVGLSAIVFLVSALAHAQQTPAYLAQELLSPLVTVKSLNEFTKDASRAGLISIGETHGAGPERQMIKKLYDKLFSQLGSKPACLVETFNLLFNPEDPSTPLMKSQCRSITSLGRLSVGITDVAAPLAKAIGAGTPVITHTGFRHIMPMGLLFSGRLSH